MHVSAGRIEHAAHVDVRADFLADRIAVKHHMVVHAVARPERLLGLEFAHVTVPTLGQIGISGRLG